MGAGLKFNFAGFLHILESVVFFDGITTPSKLKYRCDCHVSGMDLPEYFVEIKVKTEPPFFTPKPDYI